MGSYTDKKQQKHTNEKTVTTDFLRGHLRILAIFSFWFFLFDSRFLTLYTNFGANNWERVPGYQRQKLMAQRQRQRKKPADPLMAPSAVLGHHIRKVRTVVPSTQTISRCWRYVIFHLWERTIYNKCANSKSKQISFNNKKSSQKLQSCLFQFWFLILLLIFEEDEDADCCCFPQKTPLPCQKVAAGHRDPIVFIARRSLVFWANWKRRDAVICQRCGARNKWSTFCCVYAGSHGRRNAKRQRRQWMQWSQQ